MTVWFSLRRRLFTLLLGGVTVAWLCTVALSYIDTHNEVDQLLDAQLAQVAQTMLSIATHDDDEDVHQLTESVHLYQRQLRFQIWRTGGILILRSTNAPETPLTSVEGFTETRDPDGHWRHFSQWNSAHTMQIQVSENHVVRDELIAQIAWRLLMPALIGLPLIGLGLWVATRKGLTPLDDIAQQIASRRPDQLQAITPTAAPAELRPILDALNGLFLRVEGALEAEHRFTADAAHELRTPLAALRAHLQVAQRARDDEERQRSYRQLQAGLSRATHLVDQMLQLARLDPESGLPSPSKVDLGQLTAAVCAELGPQILERNLEFELEAAPNCDVDGQAEWLWVMIRNLVDNAIRYTPPGGALLVSVGIDKGRLELTVRDSGPGIPVAEREQVLRRFHRLNPSQAPGSGLGLAIVARIADLHAATLELGGEAGAGLTVTVAWPRPA